MIFKNYRFGRQRRLDRLARVHPHERDPMFRSRLFLTTLLVAAGAIANPASEGAPPGYSLSRTGDRHDFDYFVGGWTTKQRRLKARGVGSTEWEEFSAVECLSLHLDGLATVDELYMPSKGHSGLTLRTFDVKKRQWSIYWVNGATGQLDPVPTVGGFQGDHGEFYAVDEEEHRPVKVRYLWDKVDRDHARWQQAFSFDDRSWETNWVADFTRADTAAVCEDGKPRR
jgi:hypothetical protein